jgi:hypothetical protein
VNLFLAPLPRLINIWVCAGLVVLFSKILGQSMAAGLGFLASSYFGGFLLIIHTTAAVVLALLFDAARKLEPLEKKLFRRQLPEAWRLALSLSAMILIGAFTFATRNSSFATDNPSSFVICAIASTSASVLSFLTEASREKYHLARQFRRSLNGFKSLRTYLVTWGSAISIAVLGAALAVLPSYIEYNGPLWLLFTALTLTFSLSIGLAAGYLNFEVSVSILRAYLTGTRFRRNMAFLVVSRSLQILAGGMVIAYVFAPSMLPAETVILLGLSGSLVAWLVTCHRTPDIEIEN